VRIYWDIHPRGAPPTYDIADVAASTGLWEVPATMPVGSAITVEVQPWTGWTGTAVSGTAGPRVVATSIYDRGAPAISPVLDEDQGRLYLHPYRNEFSGSVRYVVSPLDIPTLEEVRAGTVSAAERILVHTF